MTKTIFAIVMVAVIAVVLVSAGIVNAQSATPQIGVRSATPQPGVPGTGYGMMGGRGARGGMNMGSGAGIGVNGNAAGTQMGFMHDGMIAAFAGQLGISVDDLNARLANGETMAQIAASKGLTTDQFSTLMINARSQAIDQEVTNGDLTQAQADWMKQHSAGQMGQMGQIMGGGRGMRGAGQGQSANPDCPYNQTTP
jgi:hypothetical protein